MILMIPSTLDELLKAKAANPGEIRTRKDGRKWKKVGKTWMIVSNVQKVAQKSDQTAENYFDHAMATNLGDEVVSILGKHGVSDFGSLVEKIKGGPPETAHRIYKELFDHIDNNPGTPQDKQAALHLMGTALVKLHQQYTPELKAKSTVKVKSRTGKEYYTKETVTAELPSVKPTEILAAKKLMGGWPVTTAIQSSHVQAMLKTGAAKLVEGKIDSKRSWVMPSKAIDMGLKYAGDSLLIRVKQVKEIKQRTKTLAKVEVNIPYVFAKAFLLKHIESKKTRNNFIFRMERSKGYKAFLERAGSK